MILVWALALLIGCGAGLCPHWIFALPLLALISISKRYVQLTLFFLLGIALSTSQKPSVDEGPHTGKGLFSLSKITPTQSPFHRSYALRGTLKSFDVDGKVHHNLPCVFFQKRVPKEGKEFFVEGKLERGILKLSPGGCKATKMGFSLTRWRFEKKEQVRRRCHKLGDRKVGHFFASMLTGDIDDRLLAMEFQKWGVSHLLAISGFHFALIALVFGFFLRLALPRRVADLSLILALTWAFIYLGPSPSIVRAYLMISLYLLGQLLGRIPDPLNLLGVALLVELILHPLGAIEVGFQLSFSATFGILALYTHVEKGLCLLIPRRSMEQLKHFSSIDKHGYLISSFLRKALALNTAVHLVTLPILLFHFGSFPLMSFPFNLFIPPLLGLSIICIPLGPLNIAYTRFLLDILSYSPESFNFQLFTPHFPFELIIACITLFGILGLTLSPRMDQNHVLF